MQVDGEAASVPEQVTEGQLTINGDGTWEGFFSIAEGTSTGDEIPSTVQGEGDYQETETTIRFFLDDVNYQAETQDIDQITGDVNGDRLSIELERAGDENHSVVLEKD
jgi:hypothetical protein